MFSKFRLAALAPTIFISLLITRFLPTSWAKFKVVPPPFFLPAWEAEFDRKLSFLIAGLKVKFCKMIFDFF